MSTDAAAAPPADQSALPALPDGYTWSTRRWDTHAGRPVADGPQPRAEGLAGPAPAYTPNGCPPDVRVRLRPLGDAWVCPLCGLLMRRR